MSDREGDAAPARRIETAHGTVFAVPVAHDIDDLHTEEARVAEPYISARRHTFAAGRRALRRALRDHGAPLEAPILPNDRGAPVLPRGFRGSVSHKGIVAVALVRPTDPAVELHVGVDVEIDRELRADVSRRVLTDDELSEAQALGPSELQAFVLRRFSMKEAIYKAIDPFLRRYVAFREVAIRGTSPPFEVIAPALGLRIDVAMIESTYADARLIVSTATARRLEP